MNVQRAALENLLANNVLEIVFTRRRPKLGRPLTRRMLTTKNKRILESKQGLETLRFRPTSPPYTPPHFDPSSKNLVCTWDIFMQDYRHINCDDCLVVSTIKEQDWWEYFTEKIQLMEQADKIQFMDV